MSGLIRDRAWLTLGRLMDSEAGEPVHWTIS